VISYSKRAAIKPNRAEDVHLWHTDSLAML
jgi:hypothetical protein